MRTLLSVAVVLPILLYVGVSGYLRNERLQDGAVYVGQTVRILEEHALRVFEAQLLIIDRVDRHIAGMDWDTIRTSEDVHRFLAATAASSPHVDGLWLVPPDGRTANSADFFPFPEVDVADRDYFQALSEHDRLHFGEMIVGRTKGNLNFNLSRRRSPRDAFDGVILVTTSIEYFTDFWTDATTYPDFVAGLFRDDGKILARFPMTDTVPESLASDSPLLQAIAESDDGVYPSISSIDGTRRIYGYSRIGGYPVYIGFGVEDADLLAPWRQDLLWHGLIALLAAGMLGGSVLIALRQSDQLTTAMASLRATAEDLRAEVGRRVRALDVAAEKERLLAQLREATGQRQAILDNMVEGVVAYGADGAVIYCNDAARAILLLEPGRVPRFDVLAAEGRLERADGTSVSPDASPVARLLHGDTLEHEEYRLRFPGEEKPVVCRFRGAPLLSEAGDVAGAVLTFADISEQKAEEDRRAVLMAELDHRVRNMLATIMAMVRLTSRDAGSREALVEALTGRIGAMARTHSLLTRSGWRGVELGQIVQDEVEPYAGAERLGIEGPCGVLLSPKTAVDLALVVHELATNAAKYGAWSQDHGRVDIAWQVDLAGARLVRMVWRETGGPPILAEPKRRGFGSTLLGSTFSEPAAGVDLRWETTGVVGEIRIPVAPHSGDRPEHEPAVRKPPSARPEDHALAGVSVLLAEDEPIVQMELASSLERAGARVVGPVSTLCAAITFAESEDIDAAVLDVNLNGQSVGAAAEILHARGVPMVFTTGYQSLDSLPPALRHLPRLQKPVSPEDVRARLCEQLRAPVSLTK
jgi:two-component sensor histidine kinase/PAS domain-containing protein